MKPPSCKSWGLQTLTLHSSTHIGDRARDLQVLAPFLVIFYQLGIKLSYNQARCTRPSKTVDRVQCQGVSLNGLTAPAHQDFYMTPLTRQAPRPGLSRYSLALLLAVPLALVACGGGSSDAGVAAQPSGFTVG